MEPDVKQFRKKKKRIIFVKNWQIKEFKSHHGIGNSILKLILNLFKWIQVQISIGAKLLEKVKVKIFLNPEVADFKTKQMKGYDQNIRSFNHIPYPYYAENDVPNDNTAMTRN